MSSNFLSNVGIRILMVIGFCSKMMIVLKPILCSSCGTVSLKVSKRFKPLSKEKQLYLNALPVAVAVIDAEGAIVFMNPTAQLLVDQEPHEYMRRKFVKCISS